MKKIRKNLNVLNNIELIEYHATLHVESKSDVSQEIIEEHYKVKQELDKRNILHIDRNDDLDKGNVVEQDTDFDDIYSNLPNNIKLDNTYALYKRHSNSGKVLLVTNVSSNPILVESLRRIKPKWLSNKIHIEFNKKITPSDIPVYRVGLVKVSKDETTLKQGKIIVPKPFLKFRLLKHNSGKNKGEFYSFQEFYDKWCSKNLSRGIIISKLYNDEPHAIHKQGNNVMIVHDGYKKVVTDSYPETVKEILSIPGDFILHVGLVAYDTTHMKIDSATIKESCPSLAKRSYRFANEDSIVFHIYDIIYQDGYLGNVPYIDRLTRLRNIISEDLKYLSLAKSTNARYTPSDIVKYSNLLCTQHGVYYRTADAKYPVRFSENRSNDLVKLYQPNDIEIHLQDCPFKGDTKMCCMSKVNSHNMSNNLKCSLASLYRCQYLKEEVYD